MSSRNEMTGLATCDAAGREGEISLWAGASGVRYNHSDAIPLPGTPARTAPVPQPPAPPFQQNQVLHVYGRSSAPFKAATDLTSESYRIWGFQPVLREIDLDALPCCPIEMPYVHSDFYSRVDLFLTLIEDANYTVTFNEAFRTNEVQQMLAINPNATTPAPVCNSLHEAGMALDFNFSRFEQDNPGAQVNPDLVDLATNAGLSWGGNFNTPDPVHFYIDTNPTGEERRRYIREAQFSWELITARQGSIDEFDPSFCQ